ncbi:aspartokinase 2, chloroplastic-like [Tasmannia lanceolata]|uniref:aspartokinase 2, chloroplastic-like n=1 Tax=Tasmannia lanceolata TaxID=3420 RepID=UPI004063CB83
MAASTLRFSGVETPYIGLRKCSSSLVSSRRLEFTVSIAPDPGFLCRRRRVACERRVLKIRCEKRAVALVEKAETGKERADGNVDQFTCVMKFGGSSVASAERMREVADLILSFPEERPVIVPSAMGKTTNKILQGKRLSVVVLLGYQTWMS